MQRKQQVGECWVYVLYSLHVCVWARQIRQLRLWAFLLFLVDFTIFSEFVN
jgi:hypothetical protein